MHGCVHLMRCCPLPFVGVGGIGSSGLYLGSVHKVFGLMDIDLHCTLYLRWYGDVDAIVVT